MHTNPKKYRRNVLLSLPIDVLETIAVMKLEEEENRREIRTNINLKANMNTQVSLGSEGI